MFGRNNLLIFALLIFGLVFSPNNFSELNSLSVDETDGRTGPDATVNSIISPRATTINQNDGSMMHELNAGDEVDFEAFIQNIGDTAITEMGITLTIYLSEGGSRGMVALDANGNELSWTNGDVVCDDSFVCPWSSLDAGTSLDYGKYTMMYQGSPVTWIPMVGDYEIVFEVNAIGDTDVGNDQTIGHYVSVVDWTDIQLDLQWDSGKEIEAGSGDKAFTLSVGSGGSYSWSARSIVVELVVEGTLSSAMDSDGNDILGTNIIGDVGTYTNSETFRHESDPSNSTYDYRYVLDFQDSDYWSGVVTPNMEGDSGDYSVSASLVSYVIYGQLPDCTETFNQNNLIHYCEVSSGVDGEAANNEATIEGKAGTLHDIGVTNLLINQGYAIGENGMPMGEPSMPGLSDGPLNPAWSSVQATVRHMGSDLMTIYDWEVTFNIQNTITGVTYTEVADECTFGFGDEYTHMELGDDPMNPGNAFEVGEACVWFDFQPGIYNVTATVSMVGETVSDMSASNDQSSIHKISALNNRPSVSLDVEEAHTYPTSDIIVGGPETSTITLVASADDADDMSGQSLYYVWTHPEMVVIDGTLQPSECNGMGPSFATCQLTAISAEWAGVQTYSVTVSDDYGSTAQDYENVFVWNQIVAEDTTDSGIGMMYDLTYNGINPFTVIVDDTGESYTTDLTQYGLVGEYSSIAIINYQSSTTYLSEDVNSQAMTLTYDPANFAPTSVFWGDPSYPWELIKLWDAETTNDAAGTITVDQTSLDGAQVLPAGDILFFGGEIIVVEPPTGYPNGLEVVAQKGGEISAYWGYQGIISPFDWLEMTICDSSNDCDTTMENTTLVGHSMSGQTDTVHGETYTYTLSVCNVGGCHPTIATNSATADSMVDGNPTATQMQVSATEGMWAVSWAESGDTSDVAGWMVCWTDYSWSIPGDMPSTCIDAGESTTIDLYHPSGTGTKTYYFAAVPYDDKGNVNNALPGTDITLTHWDDTIYDSDGDGFTDDIDDCTFIYGNSSKGNDSNILLGCTDSDGDGYADTIDSDPEDSTKWLDEEGEDCDKPLVNDDCIDISDAENEDEKKKDTEDDSSGLIIGIASGIGGLLLVVIILLVIIMSRNKKSNSDETSIYHQEQLFEENQNYHQPYVEPNAHNMHPSISYNGQVGSDGYEWLEHPQGSGIWYWRNQAGTQWSKHQ